ncbi:nucleotidyltransferase domain-containing protein [Methanospirillum sp.]|jgi:predicted nucleotidyltransferase|uniref:nucleotidyltransferase domain-containing protein n=1 Tax=Methanospirillum sp. TaxID=45200 RepID=UPI001BD470AC|nr:nucleotidyltransferase domain-containing protein [Methanospirillum sp.]
MLDEASIQKVVRRVIAAQKPDKIILFGSYARGEQTDSSDLDLIVVFDSVSEKGKMMGEIRNAIGRVAPGVGVDILVSTNRELIKPPPGSALYYGLREGRVLYVVES